MAKRYATLSVSSGISKNYTLQHKDAEKVKLRAVSEATSELEITFENKEKVRVQHLDAADFKIKTELGLKMTYKGKDKEGNPKISHQGWDKIGRWKNKRFVSIHEAWKAGIDFPEYFEKVVAE